jgi:Holliday junction resolvase RusA-like endonuclease
MEYTFGIDPVPASRPRVTRWGAYYVGPYKDFKTKVMELCNSMTLVPLVGELSVDIEIFKKKPKSSKLTLPRGDVDNFAKAVLDSMNGILWEDDSQIKSLYVTKDWAPLDSNGYFVVSLGQING